MYQAVLFDFDGTLVNTLKNISYCAIKAMDEVGLTAPRDPEDYKYLIGNGVDVLIRRILDWQNCDDEELFVKGVAKYREIYNQNPIYLAEIYEGMMPLLKELKKRGIKLGIVTNKPHATTLLCVEQLFGNDLFDCSCGQKEGVPVKPDPTSGKQVMKELGVVPEETIYVGDTSVDMQTGKTLGAYTVGVLWGFRKREELEEHGADLLISHPCELLELF